MRRSRFMPVRFTDEDELHIMGKPAANSMGPVIRCLLWNILKARRTQWEEDFSTLSADRDLVLLQESVLNAPTDSHFVRSTRFEWVMARSFKHPVNHTEHGIKTGSVSRSIERHFYLSPHSEPVLQTQKLLLANTYPLDNCSEPLLVLNMHAINFVSVRKYVDQLDQLDSVLAGHDGPVILGGDFNTWNPARLMHFNKVAERAGLLEATMDRPAKMSQLNQHLDHLFYRGLTLRSVESLSYISSSDHAPITATFECP